MAPAIVRFGLGAESTASLDECGGKAVNLVRLAAAGFPVPPGFVITTPAYRTFLDANDLGVAIDAALAGLDPTDADALEAASARIRAAFADGTVPDDLRDTIVEAAAPEAGTPVAVRSSATAEDLPELSFAGQQDTYLNVVGREELLTAIVGCWSSLWTARAIGYRVRAGISHTDTALAVVVQRLVPSEVSGVMFTADPLDGRRDRVVVDATYGLGEALVSGLVEPDHYVVADGGVVLDRTAGAKAVTTVARAQGGVDTVAGTRTGLTLTDVQLVELAALGRRVEAEYGAPQDIEWAYADGRLWLLQSRAVTSLFPLPDPGGAPGDPAWDGFPAWFSFGSFQGMLEPVTPIGQDAIVLFARGLTALFKGPAGPRSTTSVPFVRVAGERLWIRLDHALRTRIGAELLPRFLAVGDPACQQILDSLAEPRLAAQPGAGPRPLAVLRGMAPMARIMAASIPVLLRRPVEVRHRLERECEQLVRSAEARERRASAAAAGDPRLQARLDAMEQTLEEGFPVLLPRFGPIMGSSVLAQRRLVELGGTEALGTLRSLEGNVTTKMDLDLWHVAELIRADVGERERFAAADPAALASDLRVGRLSAAVTEAVTDFLRDWGMRGVGEIDLGHPRWRDDPTAVMASLRSYVALPDDAEAPDTAYQRGRVEAQQLLERLLARVSRQGPTGRLKAHRLRVMVEAVRQTFGARETPKFTMVKVLGVIHAALLASGEDLVAAGRLSRADDVMMLHVADLRRAWAMDPEELKALVAQRRLDQEREARRRQVPRVILGDGRTFYEGISDPGDGSLGGSPVSPGVAEGVVRVVLSPSNAGLLPGEILVCPGTDPAWTPLFLMAAGLVTEVGGMMTHGSVVAREYGIPAVVGVHDATTRLRTGMRVRLDGSAGSVLVLSDAGH